MAIALATNHRPRKSLAAELDRLDKILDCLSDGLNEAVRDTVAQVVRDVVREAVQVAVGEALADAQLRAQLSPTQNSGTASPIRRGWRLLTRMTSTCWNWTVSGTKRAFNVLVSSTTAVSDGVRVRAAATKRAVKNAAASAFLWSLLLARLAIR